MDCGCDVEPDYVLLDRNSKLRMFLRCCVLLWPVIDVP